MQVFIKGKLAEIGTLSIVVENMGIGYEVFLPLRSLSRLPSIGKEIFLHTSLVMKEQAWELYGFLEKGEKNLFTQLIQISGIGPKMAINLIGHIDRKELFRAVQLSDATTIRKVPGIGKKMAERIIIEMRDKSDQTALIPSEYLVAGNVFHDAKSALMNLGYDTLAVQKTLEKILAKKEEDISTVITKALRVLSK